MKLARFVGESVVTRCDAAGDATPTAPVTAFSLCTVVVSPITTRSMTSSPSGSGTPRSKPSGSPRNLLRITRANTAADSCSSKYINILKSHRRAFGLRIELQG